MKRPWKCRWFGCRWGKTIFQSNIDRDFDIFNRTGIICDPSFNVIRHCGRCERFQHGTFLIGSVFGPFWNDYLPVKSSPSPKKDE